MKCSADDKTAADSREAKDFMRNYKNKVLVNIFVCLLVFKYQPFQFFKPFRSNSIGSFPQYARLHVIENILGGIYSLAVRKYIFVGLVLCASIVCVLQPLII